MDADRSAAARTPTRTSPRWPVLNFSLAMVLVTAACAGSGTGDAQSTGPGSTGSDPSSVLYPVEPTVGWELTAGQADPSRGPGAVFTDPTNMALISFDTQLEEDGHGGVPADSRPGAGLLAAEGMWIAAVVDGADLSAAPALVGVDPGSGAPTWTYRGSGDEAQLLACANALVDGALACLEEDPIRAAEPASSVVLVDAGSGEITTRFDVASGASRIGVTGSDVIVWSTAEPSGAVARYRTTGERLWSVSAPSRPRHAEGVGQTEGPIVVSPTAVLLNGTDELRVLSLNDGALLAERSGNAWGRMLRDGGVLLETRGDGPGLGGELTILDASGAEVATLTGHEVVNGPFDFPGLAEDPPGPVLVRGSQNAVLELDTSDGSTTPTGIVESAWPLALLRIDDALIAFDGFTVRRLEVGGPGDSAWEPPPSPGFIPFAAATATDRTLLYGVTWELEAPGEAVTQLMAAIGLDDGQTRWKLPFPRPGSSAGDGEEAAFAYLRMIDDRLVRIEQSALTFYAP